MFCLHVYTCSTCVPGTLGSQKRTFGPLELGLQVFMSCHVGSGLRLDCLQKLSVPFPMEPSLQFLNSLFLKIMYKTGVFGLFKLTSIFLASSDLGSVLQAYPKGFPLHFSPMGIILCCFTRSVGTRNRMLAVFHPALFVV